MKKLKRRHARLKTRRRRRGGRLAHGRGLMLEQTRVLYDAAYLEQFKAGFAKGYEDGNEAAARLQIPDEPFRA